MGNKVFENPYRESIVIKNAIFDQVMPALTPEGWKVLCAVLRQAWGRRESRAAVGLSVMQLMVQTGIQEQDLLEDGIEECMLAGYLIRHPEVEGAFTLNADFEMPTTMTVTPAEPDFAPEEAPPVPVPEPEPVSERPALTDEQQRAYDMLVDFAAQMEVAIPDAAQMAEAVTLNALVAVRSWIAAGLEMSHLDPPDRFQTVLDRLLAEVPPLPLGLLEDDDFDLTPPPPTAKPKPAPAAAPAAPATDAASAEALWDATLEAIEGQVRSNKFKFFKGTKAVTLRDGYLVVAAPNKRVKDWLETGQLVDVIQSSFEQVAGDEIKLTFIVQS
ncbi:MAG TPA: hypothetical protein ENN14_01490 [Chloroflexi bacterium]|nr:hypothetical protein [Chloroflexota bacterium]